MVEFSVELSCDGEESWVVPNPPYHKTLESKCTELERVRRGLLVPPRRLLPRLPRLREADLQCVLRDLELNVHLFHSVWRGLDHAKAAHNPTGVGSVRPCRRLRRSRAVYVLQGEPALAARGLLARSRAPHVCREGDRLMHGVYA